MAPHDALSEFDLIKQYFVRQRPGRATLGIGDDCALITPSAGKQIAISSDMLVEDQHFFVGANARMLGHKSLAVNLSDLAAMGARPVAFTLALALPQAERAWLAGFADGLFALADAFNCELIGGDTTKGPLNICITVFGELAPGQALRRSAAKTGDDIWISGTLGDARLALRATGWNWRSRWTPTASAPPPCACIRRCHVSRWACNWRRKASPMRRSIFPTA